MKRLLGLMVWISLLSGCDLNRMYLRKCIHLCHDKAGTVEKFERIETNPPKWECACKVVTKVETFTFTHPTEEEY